MRRREVVAGVDSAFNSTATSLAFGTISLSVSARREPERPLPSAGMEGNGMSGLLHRLRAASLAARVLIAAPEAPRDSGRVLRTD